MFVQKSLVALLEIVCAAYLLKLFLLSQRVILLFVSGDVTNLAYLLVFV